MNYIEIPNLPAAHIEFANAVAAAADKAGISRVKVTYRPDWKESGSMGVTGEFEINYASTDGRGRPSKKLSIQANTIIKTDILDEPESIS